LESRITELELAASEASSGAGEASPGEIAGLERKVLQVEGAMHELADHHGNLNADHQLLLKSEFGLKQANKLLVDKLKAALDELKKEGRTAMFEIAEDIATPLRDHVRTEAYREWKFLHNETDLAKFMAENYKAVVKKLPKIGDSDHEDYVTLEDFDRIYRRVAVTKLNSRRQFSQTQMYKAVFSKCQFRSWRQKRLGSIHSINCSLLFRLC
jgi:hypothetical protein